MVRDFLVQPQICLLHLQNCLPAIQFERSRAESLEGDYGYSGLYDITLPPPNIRTMPLIQSSKRRFRITMSWFNIFKKNESALSKLLNEFSEKCPLRARESALFKLSTTIFEKSLLCEEALRPDLEKKFGKDSEEFFDNSTLVLLELCTSFFT